MIFKHSYVETLGKLSTFGASKGYYKVTGIDIPNVRYTGKATEF